MNRTILMAGLLAGLFVGAFARPCSAAAAVTQAPALPVEERVLRAIAEETSGEAAKRTLDQITLHHRTRASRPFRAAADYVRDRLQQAGYAEARIREYPADGTTMFGTQKSRLAWEAESAELWETDAEGQRRRRLADWDAVPLSLAQDSVSGEVRTVLVDIGAGTSEADYAGRDVRGRLVLTESQPQAVVGLAVGRFGAAGIVSYAPNQRSAWWKEDASLVRWGHLPSFPEAGEETFAFMVSLAEARALQQRMAAGETIHLDARVRATRRPGVYSLVEAVLPGSDPALAAEQIALTCHLDHPRPGANDNASGCAAILEVARTLKRLVDQGRVPAPRRSIRFVFPAEIEGSLIYLNADPDLASRIRATVHMDMVGGNAGTRAVYRVSTGPFSLPSFMPELGDALARFVNTHSLAYAGTGDPDLFALVAPEGDKGPLQAEVEGLAMGSDHDVFREGSWRIPGLYLHDWPDRYIHTHADTPARIDPTKLKRSAFIGAVAAHYLADLGDEDLPALLSLVQQGSLRRAATLLAARQGRSAGEADALSRAHWAYEAGVLDSIERFAPLPPAQREQADAFLRGLAAQLGGVPPAPAPAGVQAVVYARNPALRGTLDGFGYSYLDEALGAATRAALPLQGEQAYEALNLVDGRRSVAEISDWMLAAFGHRDVDAVAQYLRALESIDVIRAVPAP